MSWRWGGGYRRGESESTNPPGHLGVASAKNSQKSEPKDISCRKPPCRDVLRKSCRVCAGADRGRTEAVATEAVKAVGALLVPCLGDFRASEYGVSEDAEGRTSRAWWCCPSCHSRRRFVRAAAS